MRIKSLLSPFCGPFLRPLRCCNHLSQLSPSTLSSRCPVWVLASTRRHFSAPAKPGGPTTAIAFDIDGVLIRGKELIPQAREALHLLAPKELGGKGSAPLPFIFLTNGGGVNESEKAAELSSWFDLRIPPSMVCLSHSPLQSLLPTYRHSRLLVLGMSDVSSVARHYGFTDVITMSDLAHHHPELVPHLIHEATGGEVVQHTTHQREQSPPVELASIDVVAVMHDPNAWYRDMQILLDVMTARPSPPLLLFTNPDFLFSGRSSSPRLAQGAFRIAFAALYEKYTGRELEYRMMGKPTQETFDWAARMLQTRAKELGYSSVDRYVMIGDNPAADIRGGNGAGWTTVFVRTGTLKESEEKEEQPTHKADNVLEAVKWIVQTNNRHDRHAQGSSR